MTEQVYLCTSSHFHPIKDPHDPLCLVWIAVEGHYDQVTSKVYRSHNFVEMLNLAHQMADDRGMKLTGYRRILNRNSFIIWSITSNCTSK